MAHNLEQISDAALSALTIRGRGAGSSRSKANSANAPVYARFTKLGGYHGLAGLRIKVRSVDSDSGPGPVDIRGEDLYALREFIAELPEEAFVRPADPVEKPERWADNDVIEETSLKTGGVHIWTRYNGKWHSPKSSIPGADHIFEAALDNLSGYGWTCRVLRQASGQDL